MVDGIVAPPARRPTQTLAEPHRNATAGRPGDGVGRASPPTLVARSLRLPDGPRDRPRAGLAHDVPVHPLPAREHAGAAFANAGHVLRLEHQLGIANEQSLQQAALHHLWLIQGLNRYYVSVHFPATVGFLVYLYIRAPDAYRPLRRLFVAVTGAALAIHVLFPLAPPRMMPGYVDTVARYGPRIYERSVVSETANQFAAMPSLHFGWAVLVAYGFVRYSRSRGRYAMIAHPILILSRSS